MCKSDKTPSIIPLAVRFPNVINEDSYEQLDREWHLIKSTSELCKEDDFMTFWNKVFRIKNEIDQPMFPAMTLFVKAMLCLPHSSAATERIFSAVNINKNKIRNRILTPLMNGLLLTKERLKHKTSANFVISKELIELAKSARRQEEQKN